MSERSLSRPLPSLALAVAMAAGAFLGVVAPSVAHAGDEACTTKKFHYPAVEKACKDGGRKAAKEVMKASLKKAKAAGKDWKCTQCHEDMKDFKLKDNAVTDLKPYID
jgi:hypothetical protein